MVYRVGVRELRNHTAEVMRRIEAGESAVLSSNGRAIAEIRPVGRRPRSFSLDDAWEDLLAHRADPAAAGDIAGASDDTTDAVLAKVGRLAP
jgi:prevent-host-death family protein